MTLTFNPKSCLVLIDIQNEYKDVYGFEKFRENVTKLIKKARKEGIMICFVTEKDIHGKWEIYLKVMIINLFTLMLDTI